MVDKVAVRLQQYEESLSSSLTSAVEKLVQRFEKNMSYSPPVWVSISVIRSKRFSAQERGYRGYTPWGTLWFYLRDQGEDMRKRDGKPTSSLETRVRELQGKTQKGILLEKMLLQFLMGSSPDRVDSLILSPIFLKGSPSHFYSKWVANSLTRFRGALPPARWRKGTIGQVVLWAPEQWFPFSPWKTPQCSRWLFSEGLQLVGRAQMGAEKVWGRRKVRQEPFSTDPTLLHQ